MKPIWTADMKYIPFKSITDEKKKQDYKVSILEIITRELSEKSSQMIILFWLRTLVRPETSRIEI